MKIDDLGVPPFSETPFMGIGPLFEAFQSPNLEPPIRTSEGLSEGNPETQRAFAVEGTARPLMSLLQPGYKWF